MLIYNTVALFIFAPVNLAAQSLADNKTIYQKYLKGDDKDVFGTTKRFIENIGQYGEEYERYPAMGKIIFGYEGFGVPVLFTSKGLIYLHRKIKGPTLSEQEKEERKRKKKKKEEEIEELRVVDRAITMEWINANKDVEITGEAQTEEHHTYGMMTQYARAYEKITCKNLYDGIDLVYTFVNNNKTGFEYSLIVHPGADLGKVKIRYGGDLKKIKQDKNGNLVLKSDAGITLETIPVMFYSENIREEKESVQKLKSGFQISGNVTSFSYPENYDKTKELIIDPFVSGTGSLTGTGVNAGLAKDVDFDYAGNVYITGGGNGSVYKVAKFDATGVLQWTFSGTLAIPAWSFGTYYGGWVVDKNTGNVYLGQGFAPNGGHRIIRINTTGIYDNYITTANASFLENWKMYWNCNSGSPQILVAGGGTNSNINFGVCAPPSTIISSLNVTGIPYSVGTGWAQDISDLVIDPATNALYTIYGSLYGTPSLSNKIYKNNAPYSGASVAWNVASGFTVIQEIANRPYLVGPEIDNSSNVFAINSTYLFYWDGKNLKAFDKATGAGVGSSLTIPGNTNLMCGGIIADECNNIFVGSTNGTIKVYSFNGATFDDAAKPDISIPGFSTSAVYDLAYYESQKLLYASGNGFVGSFDVSSYNCSPNLFTLNVNSSCATLTATTVINPAPPAGSTVTYVLYNGTIQIASNTTGVFTGLTPNITYSIKATVNQICSGAVTTTTFTLPGPAISTSITNTTCGTSNGAININVTGGTAPYSYSKDGITFQPGNSYTGLASGLYTITVKDVNGCSNTTPINILNADGPAITFTKTDATCGSNTGSITANGSGGSAPITYSINGTTFQTNNFFPGIAAGTYTLTAKDATGCTNVTRVTINNMPGVTVTAIPATTYCNTNNGSITVIASGGTAPLQYSLNANIYQSSNIFNTLTAGIYTVTVKDANGCLTTTSATVANSAAPTVTATAVTASCANANGSITATGTGGVAPLQYSINGITFQSSNFFPGLTSGAYIVTVKDVNNCTSTAAVTVNSTGGPQVTAVSTASLCSTNTGTITASGSGGVGLLQYSIDGINFQSSTLFSGLAASTYNILVKDVNGCLGATISIVSNTTAPTVSALVTPTACNSSNGIITATGSGGTIPYQYSIDGTTFQSGNIFSALATGPYTVTIIDANGCISSTAVTVTNVAGLSISASVIASSCSSNNGSIAANGLGGAAPLQYSINGVTYQSSNIFNSLAGGNYTVYVKDVNGCIATTRVTLLTLVAPQITATSTDANCNGNNGTISADGSEGTPPLQYSINGVTYQSSGDFINVAPGTYTVYVKDAANCIQTTSVTITNFGAGPGITSFTVRTRFYPCNGDVTGSITNPRVNGANCSTCTFSLDFGPFVANATQLFTGLSPGVYTLTAKDANGCTKTITVTLAATPSSTATVVVTGTACNTSNGTIKITGIGPNTPYHASISGIGGPWITFDPSYTFTGLAPGIYTIIMSDDESFDSGPPIDPGGCLTTITVIVPSIGGPSVTTTIYNGSCLLNDGSITATGSGGTAPLQYDIDGGAYQASGLFTGLSSGIYVVTVTDADGCTNTKIDTIVNPDGPIVTAIATPTTCGTKNGVITATGTGGTAPLQYSINGTVFQNSGIFTGLASGTYTVRVADASACLSTATVTVTNMSKPTVTAYAVSASCNSNNGMISAIGSNGSSPYVYSLNDTIFQSSNLFTGLDAGFYTLSIKDANGCINKTGLSVGNVTAPQLTLVSTPSTCFNANGTITATGTGGVAPLQFSINDTTFQPGNIFTNLLAGPYTVIVKDANGCRNSKNILISNPNGPQTLTATIVNSTCGNNNGSITALASGGVAPLQYSINGSTFQASNLFGSLGSGNYPLTVKDANGCTKALNVPVTNLAGPSVIANPTLSSCFANDGTITAVGSGGTGVLVYSKNGVAFQSSNIFTGLSPGAYTITVKDTKGCTSTVLNIIVGQVAGPDLSIFDSIAACGGTIIANQNGGTAPFQYSINNSAWQTSNMFTCQLMNGIYTVHIMDANGCVDSVTFLLDSTAILPIELLSFTGHVEKKYNLLEWTTVSERNCDYFTLERSPNGIQFDQLTTIDGGGNSNTRLNYAVKDEHPYAGINYYRLKQTDFNGDGHYSRIISLNTKNDLLFDYWYEPSSNELQLYFNEPSNLPKTIELFDATGRKVFKTLTGENYVRIYTAGLAKSVYTLHIESENNILNIKVEIY